METTFENLTEVKEDGGDTGKLEIYNDTLNTGTGYRRRI